MLLLLLFFVVYIKFCSHCNCFQLSNPPLCVIICHVSIVYIFIFIEIPCAFRDALCLRYGWQPSRIPTNCECGTPFSVEHVLSCPKGGYPSIRHNEIRDLSANLMSEVCNNVSIEPHLQPITGEHLSGASANTQDGARLDIAANGLWGSRYERTYFDVRVFNPHAASNRNTNPSTCYRKHEKAKKRSYEQ